MERPGTVDRVLFVVPPYTGSRVRWILPAGTAYVAEYLQHAGVEYRVVNMSAGIGMDALFEEVRRFSPGMIGMFLMTQAFRESYAVLEALKTTFPGIPLVAGGPHVSLFREKVLEACPALDYGVVLEGEETMLALCRGESPDRVKGLLYRDGGTVVFTGEREWIRDLDSLPFPRYEGFSLERYMNPSLNALPLVSSRGCPFACIYCPVAAAIGRRWRSRSAEGIVREIEYWYDRGYRLFSFADDNFTLDGERVKQMCKLLLRSGMKDLQLACDNGIRADRADADLLRMMYEAGFRRIAVGVESASDRVLRILKKSERVEMIAACIEAACRAGMEVSLFFLVGSPGETEAEVEESFRFALRYPIGVAYFYNIVPYPGTELFRMVEATGRFLVDPDDYLDRNPVLEVEPLFETPELPASLRRRLLRRAFAVTRRTMRNAWSRRLSNLGPLARPLARVYASSLVQNRILPHPFLRRVVYSFAGRLLGRRR